MSASRDKRQRQNDTGHLTQQQRKELAEQQADKRKTVTYTVIGVVVAILVAALLIWDSQLFQRGMTAVTVGDRSYTAADVTYYYRAALNTEYQMAQYGISSFDPNLSPKKQFTDEEMTETYYDRFMTQATDELTRVAALEDAANAAGYTLTEEDKANVDAQVASIKQGGYTVKGIYGKVMNNSAYRTCVARDVLVDSFVDNHSQSVAVTDEELDAYYAEHADTLDSYDFRQFFISGAPAAKTDADGATVEATDEETAAALSAAKLKAEAAVQEIQAAADAEAGFIAAAPKYVADANKASYEENADHSLTAGITGASMSQNAYAYAEWLMDSTRQSGEVGIVETDSGFYVLLFQNRYLNETATVDIRHSLIMATLDQVDDPATADVDESKVPSQTALDAAKAEAQAMLDKYNAGEKTPEAFGVLAEETSDDTGSNTNGGLYEKVPAGNMFEGFDAWIMDAARQPGDVTLIENPQSGQEGWHVVYFQGQNDPVWKGSVEKTIRDEDTTAWQTALQEGYTATLASGAKYVK